MKRAAFGHRIGVVATLEHAHQSSTGKLIGNLEQNPCERDKVVALQTQRTDGIILVAVKTSADEHQLWLDPLREGEYRFSKQRELGFPRGAKGDGQIHCRS